MEEASTPACSPAEASSPCERVSVATSARLHFGFLDPSGRGERPFGSFGLAIDRPQTRLTIARAAQFRVTGIDCARAESYLRGIAAMLGTGEAYQLQLDEVIPAHAGLGSGTQLALAIGSGLASLEGLPADLGSIAAKLERGRRSGIGIGTFAQGGAVLDGGPGKESVPPVLCALPFPSDWRVLLIFDPACRGLSGEKEIEAFAELPAFVQSETAELCRRILLDALPGIAEGDFKRFCGAVGYMQRCMGAYFGPLQGGLYTSKAVAEVLDAFAREGVSGIGQSSWGPTGFAFAPSQGEAEALQEAAEKRMQGSSLRFEIAQARNRGAAIERSLSRS